MNNRIIVMCVVVVGLVALVAGCGKTENAAPLAREADKMTSAPKAEPGSPAEQLVAQPSNGVAITTEEAKTRLQSTVKPGNMAMTPVNEIPSTAVAATNTAAATPPSMAGEAQTTLAGLSQDQVVQGLKDALAKGLQGAIANLGHDGGFLTNLNVKIPMPEKLQTVEKAVQGLKDALAKGLQGAIAN